MTFFFGLVKYIDHEAEYQDVHTTNTQFFSTEQNVVKDIVDNHLKNMLERWGTTPHMVAEMEMDLGGFTEHNWDNYIKMKKIVTVEDLTKFVSTFSDDPGQRELGFTLFKLTDGECKSDGKRQRVN